jgi:hypothetical protein
VRCDGDLESVYTSLVGYKDVNDVHIESRKFDNACVRRRGRCDNSRRIAQVHLQESLVTVSVQCTNIFSIVSDNLDTQNQTQETYP